MDSEQTESNFYKRLKFHLEGQPWQGIVGLVYGRWASDQLRFSERPEMHRIERVESLDDLLAAVEHGIRYYQQGPSSIDPRPHSMTRDLPPDDQHFEPDVEGYRHTWISPLLRAKTHFERLQREGGV
ncbi:MAG TPA: hypothetical protein VJI13_05790 [Candidatus Norongarragalinales archaeon]|nr:hypothetical protein [Candidatus Norongarragalinales archaeon]